MSEEQATYEASEVQYATLDAPMPDVSPERVEGADMDSYRMPIAVNNTDRRGQFVDLSRMRTDRYLKNPVVRWKHGRGAIDTPIGRTTSLQWNQRVRSADFEFASDPNSKLIKRLYDSGFVRAASIGWVDLPLGSDPNYDTELVEWSLTDIPADPDAVRSEDSTGKLVRAISSIEWQPEQEAEMDNPTQTALDIPVAAEPAPTRERDLDAEIEAAVNKRMEEYDARQTQGEAEKVRSMVSLILAATPLLPDGYDAAGAGERDILIAAVGDEIPAAAERSTEYLRASLDAIVRRRAEAEKARNEIPSYARSDFSVGDSGMDMHTLRKRMGMGAR